MIRIYVGNLHPELTVDDLRAAFESHGHVTSVSLVTDRQTGRSRGFGFVEMPSDERAQAALDEMNGLELRGRRLEVTQARPRATIARRFGG